MPKKFQLNLDDSAMQIIAKLQQDSGARTLGEVLRAALGLYDWAHEQVADGYAVGAFKAGVPATRTSQRARRRERMMTNGSIGTITKSCPCTRWA